MPYSHSGSAREQVGLLRRQSLPGGDPPFTGALTEGALTPALAAVGTWLGRAFSPLVTLWAFRGQGLSADHPGRAAAARPLAHRLARGQRPGPAETGAYCRARQRLPEPLFADAACSAGRRPGDRAERRWPWQGRRVYLFDGTTVTMPDTREDQAAYPQVDNQRPGPGLPIARPGAVTSLACGAVVNLGPCPYAGKGQGEVSWPRRLWDVPRPGDARLGGRPLANWATAVLLRQRGVAAVGRLNTARRRAGFRRGRRPGPDGHLARWAQPTSTRPLGRGAYHALPDFVTAREARARVRQPGPRAREVAVVAAPLGPRQATGEGLATLNRARRHNEPGLRPLKPAMRMRGPRCKTPGLARKEVWAHALAYNLLRTVRARAAARHGVAPRPISFTGAMRTSGALQPRLGLGAAQGAAGRWRQCHD